MVDVITAKDYTAEPDVKEEENSIYNFKKWDPS